MLFKTLDILRGAHLNLTYLYIMNNFLLIPWTWVVYQIPIHMLSKNTWMGHAFLSQMPATRETLRHFLCMNISLEPSGCFFVSGCDWMNIVTMVDINVINTVLYIRKHSFSFKSQRWKALEVISHGDPTLPPTKTHGVFCVHVCKGNDAWKRLCGLHLFVGGCEPNRQGQGKKHTDTNKKKDSSQAFLFLKALNLWDLRLNLFVWGIKIPKKSCEVNFWERVYFEYLVIFYCWMVRCLGATLWKTVHLDLDD